MVMPWNINSLHEHKLCSKSQTTWQSCYGYHIYLSNVAIILVGVCKV
jgi:hypothetical protein